MSVSMPEKHIAKAIARFESCTRKPVVRTEFGRVAKIITLSRDYGTDGRAIGEMVAKKLGSSLWDREIMDVLAGQSGWKLQARMFEALDEKAQGAIDSLVADFFGDMEKHNYFHLLPKAICTIAQKDAVIIGRGARLILPHSFRVKIEASFATRIRAVAALEGITEKSARQKVKRVDEERSGFLKQIASTIGVKTDRLDYDLVINIDNISCKNAAQTIFDAFERFIKDKK
jgi:cytidylate kinase